jgi:hypothetical protein
MFSICPLSTCSPYDSADVQQQDDEFDKPYLAGFEWDPSEDYTRFVVHQTNTPTSFASNNTSSKKKKKAAAAEE